MNTKLKKTIAAAGILAGIAMAGACSAQGKAQPSVTAPVATTSQDTFAVTGGGAGGVTTEQTSLTQDQQFASIMEENGFSADVATGDAAKNVANSICGHLDDFSVQSTMVWLQAANQTADPSLSSSQLATLTYAAVKAYCPTHLDDLLTWAETN